MTRKLCVYDTEFSEKGKDYPITLISLGMVLFVEGEDEPKELYLVNSDFDEAEVNPWVRDNVLPYLPPIEERISLEDMKTRVKEFLGISSSQMSNTDDNPSNQEEDDEGVNSEANPENNDEEDNRIDEDEILLLANFADYDHVVFSQHIFGIMANYPRTVKMFTLDLQQYLYSFNVSLEVLPKEQEGTEHIAIDDARFNVASLLAMYKYIEASYPDVYETLFRDKYIPDMSSYEIVNEESNEESNGEVEEDSEDDKLSVNKKSNSKPSIFSFRNSLDQGHIPSYLEFTSDQ